MSKSKNKKNKKNAGLSFSYMLIGVGLFVLGICFMYYGINSIIEYFNNPPKYYIQDLYNYCCNHLNNSFTPNGENYNDFGIAINKTEFNLNNLHKRGLV